MTTKIHLKNVRAYGYIGHLPEENVLGQWFAVDATLWVDFEAATVSDDLADTLDYCDCISKIETLIQTAKFALIERLVGAIADRLLEDERIMKVNLIVTKQPPIPNFQGQVQVELERTNSEKKREVLNQLSINTATSELENVQTLTMLETKLTKTSSSSKLIKSIYADGACSGNPGPGGWGVVINFADGKVKELGGGARLTTNNQMELQGAIAGLEFLSKFNQSGPIEMYTDSKYVIDGISKWIKGWRKNGWQTKDKKPVKNQELWQTLDELNSADIQWCWVQGHAGDRDNTRCDEIARAYAMGQIPNLQS